MVHIHKSNLLNILSVLRNLGQKGSIPSTAPIGSGEDDAMLE